MNSTGSKSAVLDRSEPLSHLEEWDEFVRTRYPAPAPTREFRDYRAAARPGVEEFYRQNHRYQTLEFVLAKKREYLGLNRRRLGVWEALEWLNTLVDDSDPDTELSQLDHAIQSAEAVRRDGHPEWMVLTCLIHDLGKILCFWGEPQWAVVGDTFPVGCAFSDAIVYPEFFEANPDRHDPKLNTETGIYEPGCGLDQVHLSWGHDEYLYQVVRDYLPAPALAMIRYHSFYPWHREGAYQQLMGPGDEAQLRAVRLFNPYDLYSKAHERPDHAALVPYYRELVSSYFPQEICW